MQHHSSHETLMDQAGIEADAPGEQTQDVDQFRISSEGERLDRREVLRCMWGSRYLSPSHEGEDRAATDG